jgi:hypothetical protein
MNTLDIIPNTPLLSHDMTQEQWTDTHQRILMAKRYAGKWLSESRKIGTKLFGLDYVAEVEVQLELSLGLPDKEESKQLNANDKSRAIVTIEGIAQSFSMWQRKVASDIEAWDRDKITKALDLLSPIEEQIRKLRDKLQNDPTK